MFGLPAAALAMYQTAKPENRSKIKGLLISGVIATFVTGITEPIEFLFLFISPLLWIFHVIMTGAGFMVMSLLGVTIGNTDGGVLDFSYLWRDARRIYKMVARSDRRSLLVCPVLHCF